MKEHWELLTINVFEHGINNKIAIHTADIALDAMKAVKDNLDTTKLDSFSADMNSIRDALRNALDEESLLEMDKSFQPQVEDYTVGELIFKHNDDTLVTKQFIENFKDRFIKAMSPYSSEMIKRAVEVVENEVIEVLDRLKED